jgi:hypothetical protein
MDPNSALDVRALQAAIEKQAALSGPEPPFAHLQLQLLAPILAEDVCVEPNPPLVGRSLYERLWVVINSIVRRVVRYGVEPSVIAHNDFNAAVQRSLTRLVAGDARLRAEIVRLRARGKHGRT